MNRIAKTTFIIGMLLNIQAKGQVSLYAREMDDLWNNSRYFRCINRNEVIKKMKFSYRFYKDTRKLWLIVAHQSEAPHLLIYIYRNDSLVMIAPVAQQSYYILNNNLVYAKELKHSAQQIRELINRAHEYRLQAYKRLYRRRKFRV